MAKQNPLFFISKILVALDLFLYMATKGVSLMTKVSNVCSWL